LTLRIDVSNGKSGASVRVAGRLDGAAARELWETCLEQRGAVTLDLQDLTSADTEAIETLRGLRDIGGRIVGASPYVRLLLRSAMGDEGAPSDPDKEEE
jgi:anti-anti-sigma regulatory factor